jgi:hypothetical protein
VIGPGGDGEVTALERDVADEQPVDEVGGQLGLGGVGGRRLRLGAGNRGRTVGSSDAGERREKQDDEKAKRRQHRHHGIPGGAARPRANRRRSVDQGRSGP